MLLSLDAFLVRKALASCQPTLLLILLSVISSRVSASDSDPTHALPDGSRPHDARLTEPLKDLNGYFPFVPPVSMQAWEVRAREVRRRVQFATGQWPPALRSAPKAIVHGLVDRPEYTVERIILQNNFGCYVTGSLYRPKPSAEPGGLESTPSATAASPRRPAVLCPHGHWENGRFHAWSNEDLARQLGKGAERFPVGGRYPLQARCVQLARMGCVVFMYDMVGYADNQQISSKVIHGWREHRPEFEMANNWGFFSTQAELRLLTPMALQTANSLTALDWLSTLPDVDPHRIGVTGASGGGTQTFILGAIDPRPAAIFPAVMVSTAMQGGCPCENASCLRIGTGNVEIAALFAPKPLGMTSADDWTQEMESKGFPELGQLYGMYKAGENVRLTSLTQFEHNYNAVSRAAMYAWMNRHLKLGLTEPIEELDFEPLSVEEMTVWTADHLAPSGGPEFERAVLQGMDAVNDASMSKAALENAPTEAPFTRREILMGAVEVLVGRQLPGSEEVESTMVREIVLDKHEARVMLLHYLPETEEIPAICIRPETWNGEVALWLGNQGKAGILKSDGELQPAIKALLADGFTIVAIDMFMQGEFLPIPSANGTQEEGMRFASTDRDLACYTYGYNRTRVAQRACDILTAVTALRKDLPAIRAMHLVASGDAVIPAILAGAIAGDAVQSLALDTHRFRFGDLADWHDPRFLPGAVKYGDLPAFIALAAPHPLCLAGEGTSIPEAVSAAYAAAKASDKITQVEGGEKFSMQVVEWLSSEGNRN